MPRAYRSVVKRCKVGFLARLPGVPVDVQFDACPGYPAGEYRCVVLRDGSTATIPFTLVRWPGDVTTMAEDYTITDGWRINDVPPRDSPPTMNDLLHDPPASDYFWTTLAQQLCAVVVAGEVAMHKTSRSVQVDPPFGRIDFAPIPQCVFITELHAFWLVSRKFDSALRAVAIKLPLRTGTLAYTWGYGKKHASH